jgi:hypothetical protein
MLPLRFSLFFPRIIVTASCEISPTYNWLSSNQSLPRKHSLTKMESKLCPCPLFESFWLGLLFVLRIKCHYFPRSTNPNWSGFYLQPHTLSVTHSDPSATVPSFCSKNANPNPALTFQHATPSDCPSLSFRSGYGKTDLQAISDTLTPVCSCK